MTRAMRIAAPAKLNLYLHVTGKRADGYHLLDGLVAFVDVHDTLSLQPASTLQFVSDGPFAGGLGDSNSNLVVRAARALSEATGHRTDIRLGLTKRLPVASGIGGGSADAAACLRGLAGLWGLDPGGTIVRDVAASLGADIPVCVSGLAAFIGDIGTTVDPAPRLPPTWVVLANPGIGLPTPDVYRARKGAFTPPMRFAEAPSSAAELAECLRTRRNDLTQAAIGLVPQIATVLGAIGDSNGCLLSRMSGSGATCFGLYRDPEAAQSAGAALREVHPAWWVASGRLLDDTADLVAS
ncbi:MAG TPA: 4-(cytidine 5'-diphospho)-2-C-methyl-D-erythritol kinase [Alphaproteobacteria bacterium]|nr:4-(cytidine 5'-diphospho)-2-C-methyl-D-erythritol kinase [Alphaproteobacteria bacterium]